MTRGESVSDARKLAVELRRLARRDGISRSYKTLGDKVLVKGTENPAIRKVSKSTGWIPATAVRFLKRAGQAPIVLVRKAAAKKKRKS